MLSCLFWVGAGRAFGWGVFGGVWAWAGVARYRGSGAARRLVWFPVPFLVGPAGLFWLLVGGWGAWCGWVGCELYSGREHRRAAVPSGLLLGGWGRASCFCLVFDSVCFVVFACFYGRSVDALASGADEGRGGLR